MTQPKVTKDTDIYAGEDAHIGDNTKANLVAFVERVERLNEEIAGLSEDRTEVYSEAKSVGFDTKTLRKVIALRQMDPAARKEAAAMLDLYLEAISDMPEAK